MPVPTHFSGIARAYAAVSKLPLETLVYGKEDAKSFLILNSVCPGIIPSAGRKTWICHELRNIVGHLLSCQVPRVACGVLELPHSDTNPSLADTHVRQLSEFTVRLVCRKRHRASSPSFFVVPKQDKNAGFRRSKNSGYGDHGFRSVWGLLAWPARGGGR